MVLEVRTHEIGIDGMRHVGTDQKAVRVHLSRHVGSTGSSGESFTDTL